MSVSVPVRIFIFFIDEYDHFINAILSDVESLHRYTKETHKEGYLRAFFNKIKSGTYSSIKTLFLRTVSPPVTDGGGCSRGYFMIEDG